MIRCSHCGKLVPAGATSCQSCGMPLTAASGGAGMVGTGQTEQQELPAWLESLRGHERPVASKSEAQPFTMDELVDENSMPNWMRQDQSKLAETGSSDAFPAVPSAANQMPGTNLEASSLIDKQSLPEWMRESQENGQSTPAGQGFSANSLIQQDALPAWMKNLASTTEPPTLTPPAAENYGLPATPSAGAPRTPQTPQAPQTPMPFAEPTPAQGFSANSLVDQQAMPDWMKGAQGPGQQGQNRSGPLSSGFAAGELIDQRSLPNWMKEQQGQGRANANPVSAMGVPVSGSGQTTGMGQGTTGGVGMPASTLGENNSQPNWMRESEQPAQAAQQPESGMSAGSLIDMNAMPDWMRESGQAAQQPGSGMSASSLIDMNAMPNWMKQADNAQQSARPAQGTPPPNNGMPASSLVDMNAAPAWMKNADNAQPGMGARGGPARAEGMRVPSRPRGNVNSQGQNSEAAANVFSSMLGVSASTPQLGGQTPMPGHQLGVTQGQQPQPTWQASQQPATNPNAQVWQAPISPIPPARSMGNTPPPSPVPYNTPAMGQPGVYGNMQPYPGPVGGGAGPAVNRSLPGQSTLGVGNMQNGGAAGNMQRGGTEEPKKKGVFEAIRDFFFH